MGKQVHPETGETGRQARAGLVELLVGAVLLSILLDALVGILPAPAPLSPAWWIEGAALIALAAILVYLLVLWDDRRIGQHETRLEVILPYVIEGRNRRVALGERRSYPVTMLACEAWQAVFKEGLPTAERSGPFTRRILPEHMDLMRYLLLVYLARYGKLQRPGVAAHGWLRLQIPLRDMAWEALPSLLRDSRYAQARGKANPRHLFLPADTTVEAFDEGEVLLRLRWGWDRPLGLRLPGGQITVYWPGPLSEVRKYDKRYEHATARLRDLSPSAEVRVVTTRLVVSVESRWNFLDRVSRFRDWGINLAHHWQEQMDYWTWRQGHLERQVDYLDWKIGWIAKGEEPSMAERLRRLDERLARLEAHLWPDEPAQGDSEGAWVSSEPDITG